MNKKWTSFLALFLAFAMAVTGVPANYAYAVETEIETETETEEFEEVSDETLDEDESLGDEEKEVIDEDSKEESEDTLLETKAEDEIEETNSEGPAIVNAINPTTLFPLYGGNLQFEPVPHIDDVSINNRQDDAWDMIDILNKRGSIYAKTGIDIDRFGYDLLEAEFFDINYTLDDEYDGDRLPYTMTVKYNFAADSPLKNTRYVLAGTDENPTLREELIGYYYTVLEIDENYNVSVVTTQDMKEIDNSSIPYISFESKYNNCSYLILRLPKEDSEIIYSFNNYDDKTDKCGFYALANEYGNVTFKIEGNNTWNARTERYYCESTKKWETEVIPFANFTSGDIKFTGTGSITINGNLHAWDCGREISFCGPTVTVNGDIDSGKEYYTGEGAPDGEDADKYPNYIIFGDGSYRWYCDKDIILQRGVLNYNPVKYNSRMIVEGGELNVKGKTAATTNGCVNSVFIELEARDGKVNVTQVGTAAGPVIDTLLMGNAEVNVKGVNCINGVYSVQNDVIFDRAKLNVNATNTGIINNLFWTGGECNINGKVGVGIPNPQDAYEDGYVCVYAGDVNITASTVGVYGSVSLDAITYDKVPNLEITASDVGVLQTQKWEDDDMMIETLGAKGSAIIYGGKRGAVLPKNAGNTIVTGYNGTVFLSAGPSKDALQDIIEEQISNQKCLGILVGSASTKMLKLYDPDGKFIKTVLFEVGQPLPDFNVDLKREGYYIVWTYHEDNTDWWVDPSTRFSDNTILNSRWQPNVYQLQFTVDSYDVSGGDEIKGYYSVSGNQLVCSCIFDKPYRYTNPRGRFPFLERIGYTFAGWVDKFGTLFDEHDICKITKDTTLYPTWETAQIALTLNTNGGKISTDGATGSEVTIEVPYGSSLNLNPETTQLYTNVGKVGYVLKGWKKQGALDATASMTYKLPESTTDPATMDPVTLVAVWEKEVTLNAPVLTDIEGNVITRNCSYPKNSKFFFSSTVNVNGVETPADSDTVEIYYRTGAGELSLYKDAIVLGNDNISIYAFAVEKGVIEDGTTVNDTWISAHMSDVALFNGFNPITISKTPTDLSNIESGDRWLWDDTLEGKFWTAGIVNKDYTGSAVTQSDVRVYYGNQKLVSGTDYTLSYKNNKDAGTATMTVALKGKYSGSFTENFTINALSIASAIAPDVAVMENGKKQNPSTKVTYVLGGKTVALSAKDFDYVLPATDVTESITGSDVLVKPGKYLIGISGKGNYTGLTTFIYEIGDKADDVLLSKVATTLGYTKVNYSAFDSGYEKRPSVIVKDGQVLNGMLLSDYEALDTESQANVSYTYEYQNNVDIGTAKVLVKATGNEDPNTHKTYIGEKTLTFTIEGNKMSSAIVKKYLSDTYDATGSAITPLKNENTSPLPDPETPLTIDDFAVTYKLGKPAVERGLYGIDKAFYDTMPSIGQRNYDYYYEYVGDTVNAGKVKINITGINGYTGTKTVTYTIKAKTLNAANCVYTIDNDHAADGTSIDATYFNYSGTKKTPAVIVSDKSTGAMVKDTDYEVTYGENIKAGKNKGTVTIKGKGKYTGTVKLTFDIKTVPLSSAAVSTLGFTNGAYLLPVPYEKGGVKLEVAMVLNGTQPLVAGTDYTLAYKNNAKVGEATVTIKGKGNFTGQLVGSYSIVKQNISNVGILATDIVYQDKANICKPKVTLTDLNGKALAQKTDYNPELVYTYNKSAVVTQKVKAGRTTTTKEFVRSAGDPVDLKNDIIPKGAEIRVTVNTAPSGKFAGSNFYSGSTSTVFRVAGADIAKATVKVKDQVMTGEPIYITKDDITSIVVNKVPLSSSDYEIVNSTYSKNVGKGRASVTIRGVGNYGGTKVINFNIVVPKAQP